MCGRSTNELFQQGITTFRTEIAKKTIEVTILKYTPGTETSEVGLQAVSCSSPDVLAYVKEIVLAGGSFEVASKQNWDWDTVMNAGFETGRPVDLSIPIHDIDFSVPINTEMFAPDPYEDINIGNWKQKGELRDYFAELEAKRTQARKRQRSDSSDLDMSSRVNDRKPVPPDSSQS